MPTWLILSRELLTMARRRRTYRRRSILAIGMLLALGILYVMISLLMPGPTRFSVGSVRSSRVIASPSERQ